MTRKSEGFLREFKALLKKHDARIQVHPFDCGQGVENRVIATVGCDQVTIIDDPGFVELCEDTIQEVLNELA